MPEMLGNGHAVIVGVGADLPVTIDDAAAVAELLCDPIRCAYPDHQVRLLIGEQATAANILVALDRLAASATSGSTAVVYFSGRGLKAPDYYLMPFGCDLEDVAGTAIHCDHFTQKLLTIKAGRLIVILDCNYSGGMVDLGRISGRVILASSRKDETSWVSPGQFYSVFTRALIEVWAGYGTVEYDSYVRILDLATYVERVVPERTNNEQHPVVKISKTGDNFAVAYYARSGEEPKKSDRSPDIRAIPSDTQAKRVMTSGEQIPEVFTHGHAVVVGVGADLPITVDDATAVAGLLRDPGRCAYPAQQVQLLTSEDATADSILTALDRLAASVTLDSTAIVYFSGHGLEMPDYYLMPYGYNLKDLGRTAIPGDVLTEKLRAIEAGKLLVLLDCCHAGGQAESKALPGVKSPLPPAVTAELGGTGRVVISSSRKDEESWTGKPYSVFTAALLEGLAGYGAFERDGYARVLDLAMYVGRIVPERTGDRQHPILKVSNLEDNFALAYYAAGDTEPKSLDWATVSVPGISPDLDEGEIPTRRRVLAHRRGALMMLEERMSEYVEYHLIPLWLVDAVRSTSAQVAELERKLGLR